MKDKDECKGYLEYLSVNELHNVIATVASNFLWCACQKKCVVEPYLDRLVPDVSVQILDNSLNQDVRVQIKIPTATQAPTDVATQAQEAT